VSHISKLYGRKRFVNFSSYLAKIENNHKKKFEKYTSGSIVAQVQYFRKEMEKLLWGQRIKELKRFTGLKIQNIKPYKKRRRVHFIPNGPCVVCYSHIANCQHHIIMLINGGSNKPYNRINICNFCHAQIHPWIKCDEKTLFDFNPKEIEEMNNQFMDITK